MCCQCGFGSGTGGGGTGNLNGDLTLGQVPVASGAHDLIDSIIAADADAATVEGAIIVNNVNGDPVEFNRGSVGGGGVQFQWHTSRGTIAAPTLIGAGDGFASFFFYGYDGSVFQEAARILVSVDGVPSAGNMPAQMEFIVSDGNSPVSGLLIKANGESEIPHLHISQTSSRVEEDLTSASNLTPVDAAESDVFTIDLLEDTEFQVPTNPPVTPGYSRSIMIRIRMGGAGGWDVTWAAAYKFPNDTPPTIDGTPSAVTVLGFYYNMDEDTWECLGGPVGPFLY